MVVFVSRCLIQRQSFAPKRRLKRANCPTSTTLASALMWTTAWTTTSVLALASGLMRAEPDPAVLFL